MIPRQITITPPLTDSKLLLIEQDLAELHRHGHDHTVTVPATSTSAGTAGDIVIDSDYLYICIAESVWKRITLSSF